MQKAITLISNHLIDRAFSIEYHQTRNMVKVTFNHGVQLFIRYNDFEEYSYHIQFSNNKLDRVRFDNYDDNWSVATKPHHFHPRNEINATKSPMVGNPDSDMDFLVKEIKKYLH